MSSPHREASTGLPSGSLTGAASALASISKALAAIAATKVRAMVIYFSSMGSNAVAPIQRPNVAGDVEGGDMCLLAAAPDLANVLRMSVAALLV